MSYQSAASNQSVLFVTGFTGRDPAAAFVPPKPSHTGAARGFAYTTRETEAATGFGTRASAAGWEVIYLSEDVFPELDPATRLNFVVKQVRPTGSATVTVTGPGPAPGWRAGPSFKLHSAHFSAVSSSLTTSSSTIPQAATGRRHGVPLTANGTQRSRCLLGTGTGRFAPGPPWSPRWCS